MSFFNEHNSLNFNHLTWNFGIEPLTSRSVVHRDNHCATIVDVVGRFTYYIHLFFAKLAIVICDAKRRLKRYFVQNIQGVQKAGLPRYPVYWHMATSISYVKDIVWILCGLLITYNISCKVHWVAIIHLITST